MKPKKITYTATEARKNFFDILNRVLYGDEEIYIKKSGSEETAVIGKRGRSVESIKKWSKAISKKDVDVMEKAIKEARKVPERKFKNPFEE